MDRRRAIACLALLGAVAAVRAEHQDPGAAARNLERAFQQAIARAEPAIACILVSRSHPVPGDFGDPDGVPEYYGSGIVLDRHLILTNYHVVRDATRIQVRLGGVKDKDGVEGPPRGGLAEIHAADNRSDLAVLRLNAPLTGPVPVLEFGRGEDLKKGSLVVALAHPYAAGFRDGSPSASWGMVSNLRRRAPGSRDEKERTKMLQYYGVLIQTDARINLGCSGGALVDLDGRLVGLTTALAALNGSEAAGGFAIPLDDALRRIIDVLKRGEEVEYGFLGVAADRRSGHRSSDETGVRLGQVTLNSPAYKAGLQSGDVILSVNGHPIRDYDDMFLRVGTGLAGQRAELVMQRDGRTPTKAQVTLAKFYQADFGIARKRPEPVLGLRVDYASVLVSQGRPDHWPIPDGVVVREVRDGTPAKEAGLTEFADVITEVNGKPVLTPADFYREAQRAVEATGKVKLTLLNPRRQVTLSAS
jgi:S1-C subfamily serine protease